ncbi:MAG TPA: phage holin family protein [Lysobacter sp.]|nr:phage holin family protein [Lysobacter sp.]
MDAAARGPEMAGEPPGEDRNANAEPPRDLPPPDLMEALRQIADTGRASMDATWNATKAFRTLLAADLSLARNAAGRAAGFAALAVIFGGTAWMLLMAMIIVLLSRGAGWPWWVAFLVCAAVSVVLAGIGAWRAIYYFDLTRMKATRRQLARLGFGELADFTPKPGSPAPTRAAVQAPETPDGRPLKDEHGVELTPP